MNGILKNSSLKSPVVPTAPNEISMYDFGTKFKINPAIEERSSRFVAEIILTSIFSPLFKRIFEKR